MATHIQACTHHHTCCSTLYSLVAQLLSLSLCTPVVTGGHCRSRPREAHGRSNSPLRAAMVCPKQPLGATAFSGSAARSAEARAEHRGAARTTLRVLAAERLGARAGVGDEAARALGALAEAGAPRERASERGGAPSQTCGARARACPACSPALRGLRRPFPRESERTGRHTAQHSAAQPSFAQPGSDARGGRRRSASASCCPPGHAVVRREDCECGAAPPAPCLVHRAGEKLSSAGSDAVVKCVHVEGGGSGVPRGCVALGEVRAQRNATQRSGACCASEGGA